MKPLNTFLLLVRRWLAFLRVLWGDARGAYVSVGLRGAVLELKLRALGLYSLTMGAPLILDEIVATMRERESLLTAYRSGVSPEHYVRSKCEALGVAVGSPSYLAVLSWAWSVVNYMESKGAN